MVNMKMGDKTGDVQLAGLIVNFATLFSYPRFTQIKQSLICIIISAHTAVNKPHTVVKGDNKSIRFWMSANSVSDTSYPEYPILPRKLISGLCSVHFPCNLSSRIEPSEQPNLFKITGQTGGSLIHNI